MVSEIQLMRGLMGWEKMNALLGCILHSDDQTKKIIDIVIFEDLSCIAIHREGGTVGVISMAEFKTAWEEFDPIWKARIPDRKKKCDQLAIKIRQKQAEASLVKK